MQRLLKISFDQALLSLTPILSWFLLSIIVDKNLINVFTITYPLQCIYGIVRSPFAVGANIHKSKDKNPNAVMSGLVIGIILTLVFFGFALLNINSYIDFMNMDPSIYRMFVTYSIINIATQTIFSFILDKLYYENKNSRANFYSIFFNLLNFVVLIGTALVTKDQASIVLVTSIVMVLFTISVLFANWESFRFHINIFKCLKYDSSSLASSVFGFLTFFFGLSNALEFGPQYGLAITFVALVTDTQWDILEAVTILAKIDISQKKFNLKKSLRNAYILVALIYVTSIAMFIGLFHLYDLSLPITLIFLGFELLDFALCPIYYLRTSFLQLNWSASKTTANRIFARAARLFLALLPTPYCSSIASISATFIQLATTKYFFKKNFLIDKNGRISKRPQPKQSRIDRLRYHDLPIDPEKY